MAKKNNKEKTYKGKEYPRVDINEIREIIGQRTSNGIQYLDRITPEMIIDANYIPDHVQKALYPLVRKKRK